MISHGCHQGAGGNRIGSSAAPRVTACDALYGKKGASESPMILQGLQGVGRATGMKPAATPHATARSAPGKGMQKWGENPAVKMNRNAEQEGHRIVTVRTPRK